MTGYEIRGGAGPAVAAAIVAAVSLVLAQEELATRRLMEEQASRTWARSAWPGATGAQPGPWPPRRSWAGP